MDYHRLAICINRQFNAQKVNLPKNVITKEGDSILTQATHICQYMDLKKWDIITLHIHPS